MYPPQTQILIIDSFATMRKILKRKLLSLGQCQILEAESETKAELLLKNLATPPQLILLDPDHQTGSGLKWLRDLRKSSSPLRQIPVALMGPRREQGALRLGLEMGAQAILYKPVHNEELKELLDRELKLLKQAS